MIEVTVWVRTCNYSEDQPYSKQYIQWSGRFAYVQVPLSYGHYLTISNVPALSFNVLGLELVVCDSGQSAPSLIIRGAPLTPRTVCDG